MYNDGLHTLVSYLIESFLQCANFVASVTFRQLATPYEARIDTIIKKTDYPHGTALTTCSLSHAADTEASGEVCSGRKQ